MPATSEIASATTAPHRGCPLDHSLLPTRRTAPAPERPHQTIEKADDGVWHIYGFRQARTLLRSDATRQAGFNAELIRRLPMAMRQPILYQEGGSHREQRAQTARFFTPVATSRNYRRLMEELSDELVTAFEARGRIDLTRLGMRLAVRVAAQVVGLTDSRRAGMDRRIEAFFDQVPPGAPWPARLSGFLRNQLRTANFFFTDVQPAIRTRRRQPREDVISHLLEKGYRPAEILTECVTYAAAGMITTREFISLATWHLLSAPELRQRYLAGDEAARYKLLHELLRLEPVVGNLHREMVRDLELEGPGGPVVLAAGDRVVLHVYDVNADENVVGEAPLRACPERSLPRGVTDPVLSFGDGHHRCPGAYIAIQETDIFLKRLLPLEPVLVSDPRQRRNALVEGYELRDLVIALPGTAGTPAR